MRVRTCYPRPLTQPPLQTESKAGGEKKDHNLETWALGLPSSSLIGFLNCELSEHNNATLAVISREYSMNACGRFLKTIEKIQSVVTKVKAIAMGTK